MLSDLGVLLMVVGSFLLLAWSFSRIGFWDQLDKSTKAEEWKNRHQ